MVRKRKDKGEPRNEGQYPQEWKITRRSIAFGSDIGLHAIVPRSPTAWPFSPIATSEINGMQLNRIT